MATQTVLYASCDYLELDEYILGNGYKKIFLVCDDSLKFLRLDSYFSNVEERLGVQIIRFSDFQPNPLYESVEAGVRLFVKAQCDSIFAVGGGSAMDVAKCIKLYCNMDSNVSYLKQEIIPNSIPLLAIPTTAGTGSEATRYAVIYYNNEKQSVTDYSCIPSTVLMDASTLETLPPYQKKATMLDAFCHAIESYWSINSTEESKMYSKEAISMILENKESYFRNEKKGNENMLRAAHLAGKAINITQTTAGHAMCYKLTSLYGIAHGHAAALCVSKLWPYMIKNVDKCTDLRGKEYLLRTFRELAEVMGCFDENSAIALFDDFLGSLDFKEIQAKEGDYDILVESVNLVRLKNNPVSLSRDSIDELYRQIITV